MIDKTRHYIERMVRSKKFAQRVMVRFDERALATIQTQLQDREDRSDYVRAAVELAIAIRALSEWPDLKSHLMANETIGDFCAKAVRRAVRHRKTAMADDDDALGNGPAA